MKNKILLLTCFLLPLLYGFMGKFPAGKAPAAALTGATVADFTLKNVDGNMLSLKDYPNAKGFIVIFTCIHCPFAKLYSKRFSEMNTKYSALGVPLIAINSMDTLVYEDETFERMAKKAATDKFNFPYLHDPLQVVGKAFGATYTPQAFVLWKENGAWVIKYSGGIDDNGEHPAKATSFVAAAVGELLQNKPVSEPETQSPGCRIYYR